LVILEQQNSRPHSMDALGMLILTAPWSFLLAILFDGFGIMRGGNGDSSFYICIAFGGFMNTLILYFIGCLFTEILAFFQQKKAN